MSYTASTLTSRAMPRATGYRYMLKQADTATVSTVPTMIVDDPSERAYVARLWAEDWNSPEDAAYDRM